MIRPNDLKSPPRLGTTKPCFSTEVVQRGFTDYGGSSLSVHNLCMFSLDFNVNRFFKYTYYSLPPARLGSAVRLFGLKSSGGDLSE